MDHPRSAGRVGHPRRSITSCPIRCTSAPLMPTATSMSRRRSRASGHRVARRRPAVAAGRATSGSRSRYRRSWTRRRGSRPGADGSQRLVSFRNNKKHNYLLRCLLKCGICGLAIHGCGFTRTAGGVERRYYRCAGVDAMTTGRDTKCPRAMIDAEVIEKAVWDHIVGLLSDPQRLVAQFERFVAETADGSPQDQAMARQLQARLDRLARADQRLLEAYQAEVISLEELAERRRTITEQHCAAVQQRDQRRRLGRTARSCSCGAGERDRLQRTDLLAAQGCRLRRPPSYPAAHRRAHHRPRGHAGNPPCHPAARSRPRRRPTRPAMPPNTGLRSDGLGPTGGLEDRPRLTAWARRAG